MGVDWGGRRIGLALSDPTRTLARPLGILARKGVELLLAPPDEEVLRKLATLVCENDVSGLVFGVPFYHLSGDPNPRAPLYLETGRSLGNCLSLPVFFHDEGQTSARARELKSRRKRSHGRKEFCDDVAAVLLLQGFLDEGAAGLKEISPPGLDSPVVSMEGKAQGR